MKNKSRGYNSPISGKKYVGFALNGSLRNQGYVGQDSISRKSIKTPFKGNYPVGHGGHLGLYNVTPIFSCYNCSNDPAIIKRSTMNNLGHVNSSLLNKNDNNVMVPSTEKNTAGNYISSQSDYIQSLRATEGSCDTATTLTKISNCNNNTKCGGYSKQLTSVSSGDYMGSIIYKKKCVSVQA
jgi:hypothetical protein